MNCHGQLRNGVFNIAMLIINSSMGTISYPIGLSFEVSATKLDFRQRRDYNEGMLPAPKAKAPFEKTTMIRIAINKMAAGEI